ncbi:MAG: flavin-containing monooxygenase [Leucobacter sp.]
MASFTHDAVIVGAGIGGLYALIRARRQGLDAVVLERGGDIGGTWYWNRYPGARCDVESFDYSYSFDEELEQEWNWTEKYAGQPEILAYIHHVADRYRLRDGVRLHQNVRSAHWDEEGLVWTVGTEDGDEYRAPLLIMATGVLSTPKIPDIPGTDRFGGELYSSAHWPETGVDFAGKRVAVIGTGSTGIQIIPEAAKTAGHVYALQRTPSYSLPAHNRPLTEEDQRRVKGGYREFRARARASALGAFTDTQDRSALELSAEEREAEYRRVYDYGSPMRFASAFTDLITDEEANRTAREFVSARIAERVRDPETAARVTPEGYALATRRLCIDTGYYESFNRENVTLVDLRDEPIAEITETGIRTAHREIELDMIVFATGFDAVTGTLRRLDIRGTEGTLREKWERSPDSWLGVMVHGFPNMFIVTGPGSPSVSSNMFLAVEQHVEFISELIEDSRAAGVARIEPGAEAEADWVRHAKEVSDGTLFRDAASWYTGANVPGKPRAVLQYLGGVGTYEQRLRAEREAGYPGLERAPRHEGVQI